MINAGSFILAADATAPISPAVPLSADFAPALLITLLWILIAAILLAPLARILHLDRRSPQLFAEDIIKPRK